MITIKKLKELIKDLPDDAKAYAYEGEDHGINVFQKEKYWFIRAREGEEEDTYTEGFEKTE